MRAYYTADAAAADDFAAALEDAAMQTHARIVERANGDPSGRNMATTLTLYLGVWPKAYPAAARRQPLLPAAGRRAHPDHPRPDHGPGAGGPGRADPRRRAAHPVGARALERDRRTPDGASRDTRETCDWGTVVLLCSDGLTKHVSDEKIAERLRTMTSSKQVCEQLLEDALADGGSDNITILVGRAMQKELAGG